MSKDIEILTDEKAPELTPEINRAFDEFFDLDADASMYERFDRLSHAIVAYRFHLLNRHRVAGKKRISEEDVFLFDCQEQLKHIEKIITSAKRLGRIPDNSVNMNYGADMLARIVKMKNTVGSIVTTVPVKKKEAPGE